MNPILTAETRFYAHVNETPVGPFTGAELALKLELSQLTEDTLVCVDGWQAWLPLHSVLQQIQSLPPPASHVGYDMGFTPSGLKSINQRSWQEQSTIEIQQSDSSRTWRMGVLLLAAALFFMPWVEVKFGGRSLFSQTGWQAIIADFTSQEQNIADVVNMTGQVLPMDRAENYVDTPIHRGLTQAWPVICAAILVVIAFLTSLAPGASVLTSIFAALTLISLAFQASTSFPLQNAVESAPSYIAISSADKGRVLTPKEILWQKTFSVKHEDQQSSFTPWYYLVQVLLAAGIALGLRGVPKEKRKIRN